MDGMGLVLAGGGGKGAYQIGVWKYLRETGLDRFVRAVSGTSVGALNAALFAAGDLDRAETIWRNIRPDLILTPKNYTGEEAAAWLKETGISVAPEVLAPAVTQESGSLAFSREGMLAIMREGVDFDAIRKAPFPCFATCLTVPDLEVRRFDLRQYPPEESQTILLASSAIPVVFDNVHFRGETYCDGGVPGFGDNIPIAPVYELNLRYILVVNLTRDASVDHSRFPEAKLIEITPQEDLGGLTSGTLDFTAEGAAARIALGYADARKSLGSFVEAALIHRQNQMIFQAFEESERKYQDRVRMRKAQQVQSQREQDELAEEFAMSDN